VQPIVVIYLLWVVWFLTWLAAAMGTHTPRRKLSSLENFVYRLGTLTATFLLFTITPWPGLDVQYRFWDRALNENLSWLLVGIAFAGFCLAWWSTVHQIAVRRWQREIVDNGPYGVVRQPFYVGLIIAAWATAAMFGRPSSLTGALLFTIAFVVKILIEEQAFREETYAYEDYIGRVPMLVPFFPVRDRTMRQAKADRSAIEPAPFRANSIEPVASMAEEHLSESLTEPADEIEEELFGGPVTAPPDKPQKSAAAIQDTKLGSDLGLAPVSPKAVQLSLVLNAPDTGADQPEMSDATTKD
jgi:protein-S-isoprenylcysteine O-methyltransferase Ste14